MAMTTEERGQYLGVVKEAFEDSMRAVKEQYGDIKKDTDGLKKDMVEVKKTLTSHSEILKSHTKTLNSHTEMIGKMMMQLEEIKDEKVSQKDFVKLDQRVAKLEIVATA